MPGASCAAILTELDIAMLGAARSAAIAARRRAHQAALCRAKPAAPEGIAKMTSSMMTP